MVDTILSQCQSPVIIDAGACEGEDSVRYALRYPGAVVYSFEPVPANFNLLQDNVIKYGTANVHCYPMALSDRSGTKKLFVSSGQPPRIEKQNWNYGNKSSSLLSPHRVAVTHPWLNFSDTIDVPVIRLDTFMEDKSLHDIHFFHLDVQGAELEVLNGLGEKLQHIRSIWLEVAKQELYKGQPLQHEIMLFLKQAGFVIISEETDELSGDIFVVHSGYEHLFKRKRPFKWLGRKFFKQNLPIVN